ncbi:hypothetical protein K8Z61_02530 [Nocardioides sp. TRM66260-LWL]|uniref:hypothetical protein n=1 Tax=Nocardioides sp. TRM66260-LWL TaxID=2874478 RepID=UPI001CC71040|nr:hypothetical protein [Nocardioides sp. TRM66260-LWL]MBZ5733362.1 hypothetical protein [Nocardioides sp. TRM66260-LWL]
MSELSATGDDAVRAGAPESLEQPGPSEPRPSGRERWGRSVVQAVVCVVVLAVAGAAAGWLWEHLATLPRGAAVNGSWVGLDETDYRDPFAATALYVLIAGVAGLVLGLVLSLALARDELVTLAGLVLGATVAGVLMWQIGQHLGPPDPDVVARTAADRTPIPGDLRLGSWVLVLVWPAAAALAANVVFFFLPGCRRP